MLVLVRKSQIGESSSNGYHAQFSAREGRLFEDFGREFCRLFDGSHDELWKKSCYEIC